MNLYNLLSKYQKKSLKNYQLFTDNDNLTNLREGDKIKFIEKHNLRFSEGGKITKVTPYFIIIQLLHNMSKILYPEYCYIFYHRDMRKTSNKLRYLLEGLNNKSIKITKKNLKIDSA